MLGSSILLKWCVIISSYMTTTSTKWFCRPETLQEGVKLDEVAGPTRLYLVKLNWDAGGGVTLSAQLRSKSRLKCSCLKIMFISISYHRGHINSLDDNAILTINTCTFWPKSASTRFALMIHLKLGNGRWGETNCIRRLSLYVSLFASLFLSLLFLMFHHLSDPYISIPIV